MLARPRFFMAPKCTVYLFGDAGTDRFVLHSGESGEEEGPAVDVPSGVRFMNAVLPSLLPADTFSVETLISMDRRGIPIRTIGRNLAKLRRYDGAVRIAEYGESQESGEKRPGPAQAYLSRSLQPQPRSFLVAHHAGEAWNDSKDASDALAKFLAGFGRSAAGSIRGLELPDIVINVSAGLPQLNAEEGRRRDQPFKSQFWSHLYGQRHRVAIVLSASTLRREGGAISRRLSWEQGAEDFCAELRLLPRLAALARFRHIFFRVGLVGFIHVENFGGRPDHPSLSAHLYFSPRARDGIHRAPEVSGTTIGRNTIFIAALVRACRDFAPGAAEQPDMARREMFRRVIRDALVSVRRVDDAGYDADLFRAERGGDALIRASVAPALAQSGPGDAPEQDTLSWRPIPGYLLASPPPAVIRAPRRWEILDDALIEAPVHRINIAMAVVKAGHEKVLNRPWSLTEADDSPVWQTLTRVEYWNPRDTAPDFVTLEEDDVPSAWHWPDGRPLGTRAVIGDISRTFELNVPVMTFNDLTVIERDEIESLRGIANLLRQYAVRVSESHGTDRSIRPLSIAVFGAPGAGKGFTVKQISKTVAGDRFARTFEFNMAEFQSPGELDEAMQMVRTWRDARGSGTPSIPLIFFDEFDSATEHGELGWLKYFLAPMQDGKFKGEDIGSAVFVFAGGVNPTFERFDPSTDASYENRRDSDEYKTRWNRFVASKGPDFTSRLRGHINILSINDDPGRIKHFMRRAVQLRGIIRKLEYLSDDGSARVDDALLYALLTVDRYRHGVRSMEAILEMCSPLYGRLEIASLPSRAQLGMHVDAEEFLIRVHRGRMRAQDEWMPGPEEGAGGRR